MTVLKIVYRVKYIQGHLIDFMGTVIKVDGI
jgi:hypothetical protein